MVRIRYPTGLTIEYTGGHYVGPWGTTAIAVYTKKDGNILAIVPHDSGATVDFGDGFARMPEDYRLHQAKESAERFERLYARARQRLRRLRAMMRERDAG